MGGEASQLGRVGRQVGVEEAEQLLAPHLAKALGRAPRPAVVVALLDDLCPEAPRLLPQPFVDVERLRRASRMGRMGRMERGSRKGRK